MSFVIAAYNAAKFIRTSVRSALDQANVSLEVIVIDDGSQDDTADLVNEIIKEDGRVRLLTQSNSGVSVARNRGIVEARGVWIAIMDADDLIEPERSITLITLADISESDLICDNLLRFLDEDAEVTWPLLRISPQGKPFKVEIADYLNRNKMFRGDENLGYLKPIIKRSFILGNNIRYNSLLRTGEDFDFSMQCLIRKASFIIDPRPYYKYRVIHTSLSRQILRSDIKQLIEAHDNLFLEIINPSRRVRRAANDYRRSLVGAELFVEFREGLRRRNWKPVVRQGFNAGFWETVYHVVLGAVRRRWKHQVAKHV